MLWLGLKIYLVPSYFLFYSSCLMPLVPFAWVSCAVGPSINSITIFQGKGIKKNWGHLMTLSNKSVDMEEGRVKKSTKFSDVIYECPMCLCVGPFCHYCRHVCFSHHILLASIIIILSAQHAQHSLCTTVLHTGWF